MKKRNRILTAVLMALVLVFAAALAGCGETGQEPRSSSETDEQKEEKTAEHTPEESGSESEPDSEPDPASDTEPADDSTETEPSEPETTRPVPRESSSDPDDTAMRELLLSRYPDLFIVTAESLNVRTEPTTEVNNILSSIPRNGGGTIIGFAEGGSWAEISSGGLTGFVSASYILTGEEAMKVALENCFPDESGALVVQEAWNPATAPTAGGDEPESESEPGVPDDSNAESSVEPGPNGHIVCIDAGHQQHGISEQEPNGPGSAVMKAKLTTGTAGCVTGAAEYQVNLDVAMKLQTELVNRGYSVVMIRTTNDCPLSNAERAVMANQSGSECFLRLHCNSSTDPEVTGVMTYAPSPANPYMPQDVITASNTLSQLLLDHSASAAGAKATGLIQDDTMTGINWCQVPVSIIEMGFMSNPDEDRLLSDPAYQQKLAVGMANAVDAFFGR